MTEDLVSKALIEGAVPDGYGEISAEFFKFEKKGDYISGRYVAKAPQKAGTGTANKYSLLRKGDNVLVSFLGSTKLDDLMKQVPFNKYIIVFLDHTEPPTTPTSPDQAPKNPIKVFKVFMETPKPQKTGEI